MVAPTRAPQVRGVKCDLCKKILELATWLDQTKLAKNIEEAEVVLNLFRQHDESECLCIPKNIQNLLVGSSHFEIHRLAATSFDHQIHKKQVEYINEANKKAVKENLKNQNRNINDCKDNKDQSRFRVYPIQLEKKHKLLADLQLKHLMISIDCWKLAMEDQTSPFNPKLALRLGLTHHVIYACYLFKYYKMLDYQLLTANLLLNLFKTIDTVTLNAIIHAHFLLVKTLVECNQLQAARHCLKQAIKIPNFNDKSNYESILLTSISCEMDIIEGNDPQGCMDLLMNLTKINPEDKLQHYYARTLAASIIIKYIHQYPNRSDQCSEFHFTYRYLCAIIRRCYENSFELVLKEKDAKISSTPQNNKSNQILDHSWIKFAVSDFVFSTFDQIQPFYVRAGLPECLELLYNGLNLIAQRTRSCYWQAQMMAIGAELDLLCGNVGHCESKLGTMASISCNSSDIYLMNLLRLDLEVTKISLLSSQAKHIKKEMVMDILQRIKTCWTSVTSRLSQLELVDAKLNPSFKIILNNPDIESNHLVLVGELGVLSLRAIKIVVNSLIRFGDITQAKIFIDLIVCNLGNEPLNNNNTHTVLEILFAFTEPDKADKLLIEAANSSQLFLEAHEKSSDLTHQLSRLTLNGDSEKSTSKKLTRNKNRKSRLNLGQPFAQRATYDVAKSNENISIKTYTVTEALEKFTELTSEDLALIYLRNSVPSPDFLLYRRAHEILFIQQLKERDRSAKSYDSLLYHFCESITSNTIRYRWMMFDEQQASSFDSQASTKFCNSKRHLGFSSNNIDVERSIKSFTRSIPEDDRLLQLKYHYDEDSHKEHLFAVRLERDTEPIYAHVERIVSSDDFFEDARNQSKSPCDLRLTENLISIIERAKQTLFMNNQKSRMELREKLESEVGLVLHNIENEWLGPFRFLLCGKITDKEYIKFVSNTSQKILTIMKHCTCSSEVAMKSVIEYAPFLDRTEFCKLISSLFNWPAHSQEIRKCFDNWSKAFEDNLQSNQTKTSYILSLQRAQIGLILDKNLEHIPFETLPITRVLKQSIFRVPSLRIFSILRNIQINKGSCQIVDTNDTAYILDPASNLGKTRERFETKLRSQKRWQGIIASEPETSALESWLTKKDLYLFIGHGAGTTYYNRMCKGRGLSAMVDLRCASIIMGCSSGKVLAEGPKLETFGISWLFILRGCPSYLGLLWDVTDTDIDKFLDSVLDKWLGSRWSKDTLEARSLPQQPCTHLTMATAQARSVCRFKFLVGATPVVYGLPVESKLQSQLP